MILLEATVLVFGRFLVHDDYSIEEVLLAPSTGVGEVETVQASLQLKKSPWATPRETLLASFASIYGITKNDVEFHFEADIKMIAEPEET